MSITTDIDRLPSLREVIARHELWTRKSLGQHFLCDLELTRLIADLAGDLAGMTVFEIGPGPGGLTRALVQSEAAKVIAVEKDSRCLAALTDLVKAANGKLQIIEGDAMKTDLTALAPAPRAVVANLPYNVGTELLIGWLHTMHGFESLTLMFQLEVALRIAAAPGNKDYGRLSVISQFCCDVELVLEVPAEAFTPPPKVDSAVVRLTPRKNRPADVDIKTLEKVTMAAFGQRRKMLRSSLKPLGGEELLKAAGIDPTLRAENLSVADFENLVRVLKKA